jgi:hypothetical protein
MDLRSFDYRLLERPGLRSKQKEGLDMKPRTKLRGTARNLLALATALVVLPGGLALAQDTGTLDKDKVLEQPQPYSPYVDQHFPQQVLFGDMHHHTSLSVDSGVIGNNNSPDVSFRLARGEVVTSNSGQPVKLVRPLDFLVVTDHAEYLGIAKLLNEADPALLATDIGKQWPGGCLGGSRRHAERLRFRRTEIR